MGRGRVAWSGGCEVLRDREVARAALGGTPRAKQVCGWNISKTTLLSSFSVKDKSIFLHWPHWGILACRKWHGCRNIHQKLTSLYRALDLFSLRAVPLAEAAGGGTTCGGQWWCQSQAEKLLSRWIWAGGAAAFWWGAFGGGFCEAAQVALVFIDPPSSSVESHVSLSCWVEGRSLLLRVPPWASESAKWWEKKGQEGGFFPSLLPR